MYLPSFVAFSYFKPFNTKPTVVDYYISFLFFQRLGKSFTSLVWFTHLKVTEKAADPPCPGGDTAGRAQGHAGLPASRRVLAAPCPSRFLAKGRHC